MRRLKKITKPHVVALALTWDGARWPIKKLPSQARSFLLGRSKKPPTLTRRTLAALFAKDTIKEIRVCWVPQLKGGDEVLSEPFTAPSGKRLAFTATKIRHIEDTLGVVYQRIAPK